MSAVDIHPEDLIDKCVAGTLTRAEHVRLAAHLKLCASCRFEISVRGDLAEETLARGARPQMVFDHDFAAKPAALAAGEQLHARRAAPAIVKRRFDRRSLVLLAAALVLCAGGATAAVMSGAISVHFLTRSMSSSDALPSVVSGQHERKPVLANPALADASATASKATAELSRATTAELLPDEAAPPARAAASVSAEHATTPAQVHGQPALASLPVAKESNQAALAAASGANQGVASFELPASTAESKAPAARAPSTTTQSGAATLFADANRARRDGNLERAIGLYRELQGRYPSSGESELSRALLAQLLLQRGNAEAALAAFDRYLAADSPVLSAEAVVGRARCLEQLGRREQAVAAWKLVQSRFPDSVHARLAAKRLAALGTQ
jgi:TolA-binding protein